MKEISLKNFLAMRPDIPEYSSKNQHYIVGGVNPTYYLDSIGSQAQEKHFAPLIASLKWRNVNQIILDSYATSNQDNVINNAAISYFGQSFSNINDVVLGAAKFYLKNTGAGVGNITASVYKHSGTFGVNSVPIGSPLATSDNVSIATITSSLSLINFNFTGVNKIILTAGVKYILVVKMSVVPGDLNVGDDESAPTALGNYSHSTDGITWVADNTKDLIFFVYDDGVATTQFDGNIVHMVASTEGTYSAYAITSTTHVYGITSTTVSDLGFPSGGSVNNLGGRLAIAGGYVFAVWAGQVYKMSLPSGAWSTVGGSISSPGGIHFMEPFLDYIALADAPSGSMPYSRIDKLDVSALTITTPPAAGLDLGTGWGITGLKNINNKYLAIVAGRTSTTISNLGTFGYPQNYIFLWDGFSQTYNYSVKIPGQYISMKVIDSVLYVAVQVTSTKTTLFKLVGNTLRKVFVQSYSLINSTQLSPVSDCIFDYANNIGLRLNNTTDFPVAGGTPPILMIYGQQEVGTSQFILNGGLNFDQFCVGYDGLLYGNVYNPSSNSDIYYYPSSSTFYNTIVYNSQWIPVKNLVAIDIFYDTPPQSVNDAINVTIQGSGEDIISGSSSQALTSITKATILNQKRTRLPTTAFTGDSVVIFLKTVNTTWRATILDIVLIQE